MTETASTPLAAGTPLSIPRDELLARLREHKTLAGVPEREREWLADNGVVRSYEIGDLVTRKDQIVNTMWIVLAGRLAFFADRGSRRQITEWPAGSVAGMLPYSRLTYPPGDAVVEIPLEAVELQRAQLEDLKRECPETTTRLVHTMLERARMFTSTELQDEKMSSLGRLSAGLAHELNNPASAAARGAKLLMEALDESDVAARGLGAADLSAEQYAAVQQLRQRCQSQPPPALQSPLDRADREDEIADWLDGHGIDVVHASSLATTAVDVKSLNELARQLDPAALEPALRWVASGCTARSLAADIERATSRVHGLVSAIKRFTYMDRVTVPEPTDIAPGLMDTIALLGSKAKGKSVNISTEIQPDLPRVRALGGELNQAWLNLIDNALDAVGESGNVSVAAAREGDAVVVRIRDDGPGIPADVKARVFEPFFTTKPVGQGTGLGLDITRKIVDRNGGQVDVESAPGRTEFRVRLPIE